MWRCGHAKPKPDIFRDAINGLGLCGRVCSKKMSNAATCSKTKSDKLFLFASHLFFVIYSEPRWYPTRWRWYESGHCWCTFLRFEADIAGPKVKMDTWKSRLLLQGACNSAASCHPFPRHDNPFWTLVPVMFLALLSILNDFKNKTTSFSFSLKKKPHYHYSFLIECKLGFVLNIVFCKQT